MTWYDADIFVRDDRGNCFGQRELCRDTGTIFGMVQFCVNRIGKIRRKTLRRRPLKLDLVLRRVGSESCRRCRRRRQLRVRALIRIFPLEKPTAGNSSVRITFSHGTREERPALVRARFRCDESFASAATGTEWRSFSNPKKPKKKQLQKNIVHMGTNPNDKNSMVIMHSMNFHS